MSNSAHTDADALRVELVDPRYLRHAREESFHDGRFVAVSRSGLHPCERRLVAALSEVKGKVKKVIVVGNRTGFCGIVASELFRAEVHQHAFDLHHAHVIDRSIRQARQRHMDVATRAFLPDGPVDLVLLQLSKGDFSAELTTDCIQQIRDRLKPGGICLVSSEQDDAGVAEQLRTMLGKATVMKRHGKAGLIRAVCTAPDDREREFLAEFEVSLPDGTQATLASLPGVFAHRRVDEGAQALAESVEAPPPGSRLLDIGCGSGAVGIALSLKYGLQETCFIDSHARATYVTARSCRANGLKDTQILLDDRGEAPLDCFDVAVGNPPYYSNHRIAELFVETAHRGLKVGGIAYMVAKSADRLSMMMHNIFGNAETVSRRGYTIVVSNKTGARVRYRRPERPRENSGGPPRRRSRPGRGRR